MKDFWKDLFYDMETTKMSKEGLALSASTSVHDDLTKIEDAIRKYDGRKALEIIEELKKYY